MLTMSTPVHDNQRMARSRGTQTSRAGKADKARGPGRPGRPGGPGKAGGAGKAGRAGGPGKAGGARASYHHGDLPRAMLAQAVRTIQRDGVHALTLRGVGEQLGVSRTALYRHFAGKDDLLTAVAAEGFRMLQATLRDAWQRHAGGRPGFDAMGHAYIQFAVRHPSHYRVMFGGALRDSQLPPPDPDGSGDAFGTLVDALQAQQRAGLIRPDPPEQLALYVWAVVHGVAMLALDGALKTPADLDALTTLTIERLGTGISLPLSPALPTD